MKKILAAKGLWIETDSGLILDGISGTFNLPLGFNHPAVEDNVSEILTRLSFAPSDLDYPEQEELKERLILLGSRIGLTQIKLRDLSGSTAMEFALKLAQKTTGRSRFVSFQKSHHGQTIATMAVSGSASFRKKGIKWVKHLHTLDCTLVPIGTPISEIEQQLCGNFAGIIVEPILGNGGNLTHPDGYLLELQNLCHKHKICFIVDEVQTGIGRTGDILASIRYGLSPDIGVIGKGLGNGYPIAAVLYHEDLTPLEHYQHSFTTGAHPAGVAAANATLSIVNDQYFLREVEKNGLYLLADLRVLQKKFHCIEKITGDGMMWGLHVPNAEFANKVVSIALEKFELRLRSSEDGFGNVVKVRPALIATQTQLSKIVERLEKTMEYVYANR